MRVRRLAATRTRAATTTHRAGPGAPRGEASTEAPGRVLTRPSMAGPPRATAVRAGTRARAGAPRRDGRENGGVFTRRPSAGRGRRGPGGARRGTRHPPARPTAPSAGAYVSPSRGEGARSGAAPRRPRPRRARRRTRGRRARGRRTPRGPGSASARPARCRPGRVRTQSHAGTPPACPAGERLEHLRGDQRDAGGEPVPAGVDARPGAPPGTEPLRDRGARARRLARPAATVDGHDDRAAARGRPRRASDDDGRHVGGVRAGSPAPDAAAAGGRDMAATLVLARLGPCPWRSASSPASTSTPAASSRASTSRTCATPATRSSSPGATATQGADELTFLDVTASSGDRATMYDVVARTAEEVFIPLTVGGGVRTVDDVDRLLRAGADKVGVNTAAIARPALIAETADRFGAQVLVLSADVRRRRDDGPATGGFEVTTHGGRTPHRHRRRRVVRPRGRARRRRDPAQLDGRRRHQGRLRRRAHPARPRGGVGARSSPAGAPARSSTSRPAVAGRRRRRPRRDGLPLRRADRRRRSRTPCAPTASPSASP